jgi:hypothetical protein
MGDQPLNGATCRIVSYRDDFAYLWGVAQFHGRGFLDNEDQLQQMGDLVLVWDDVPARTTASVVDTATCLTAFDWVIGSSLEIVRRITKGAFACPNLRIYVLDMAFRPFRKSPAVQFFDQFPRRISRSLPWVRTFRVATTSDDLGFGYALANLLSLQQSTRESPDWKAHSIREHFADCRRTGREPSIELQTIGRFWAAGLTVSGDDGNRHALANVVGPMILAGTASPDPHDRALLRLLQQVELVPAGAEHSSQRRWIDWERADWVTRIARLRSFDSRPLNFLLLDDCAIRHGWGRLLCSALGAELNSSILPSGQHEGSSIPLGSACWNGLDVHLHATEDIRGTLNDLGIIDATTESIDLVRSRRFQPVRLCDGESNQSQKPETPIDVLFLDLRLLQDCSLNEEAKFLLGLLPAAEILRVPTARLPSHTPMPAWPGFSSEELRRVKAWLKAAANGESMASRNDDEYIQALTLVPRILALLDCSLPIVLFSSTGRRRVIDLLKPYGSILTEWAKPQLGSGTGSFWADDAATRFEMIMAAAVERAASRRLCRKLISSASPAGEVHAKNQGGVKPNASAATTPWLIELVLDESGKRGERKSEDQLTMGGLLLVYPPGSSPEVIDQLLSAQFPAIRSQDGKTYTRGHREVIAAELAGLCTAHHVSAAVVAVTGRRGTGIYTDVDDGDELLDEHVGDNLWQELFHRITELAVFHMARRHIPRGSNAELIIRVGERQIAVGVTPGAERNLRSVQECWGMSAEFTGYDARLWSAAEELSGIVHSGAHRERLGTILRLAQDTIGLFAANPEGWVASQPAIDGLLSMLRTLIQDIDARIASLDIAKEFLRKTQEIRRGRADALHASIRGIVHKLAPDTSNAGADLPGIAAAISAVQQLMEMLPERTDGTGFGLPKRCLRYVRPDSLRSLVGAIVREYSKSSFRPQTIVARAYPLNAHGRHGAESVSTAHFLADALIYPPPGDDEPNIRRLYDLGLQVEHGYELFTSLRAQKRLLMGDRAEAIAIAGPMILRRGHSAFARSLGQDVADAARRLNGPEFLLLTRRLNEVSNRVDAGRGRIGVVEEVKRTGVLIRERRSAKLFWGSRDDLKGPIDDFQPGTEVRFSGRRGASPGVLEAYLVEVSPSSRGGPGTSRVRPLR